MADPEGSSGKGKKDTGGIAVLGLQLLNVGFLALLCALSVDWWLRLPERVPIHYTPGVGPDRWSGPSVCSWFGLPAIGVAVTAAFMAARGLKGLADRHPWLISLPRGKLFSKLPPEARGRVLHAAFNRMALFPIPINLFLLYVQWVGFEVARGVTVSVHWTGKAALFAGALVVLAVYLGSLDFHIRRAAKKAGV
ncbi:MAG: hypothetical protein ACYS47_16145 [Planctomycetota bacterium]|jgi:hypothetical protein